MRRRKPEKKKGTIFKEGKGIFWRRRKTVTDKEENIFLWRRRKRKGRKYLEKENILFWRRRKTEEIIREGQIICLEEREKEENIWKKENKLEEKKTEKEKEENVWRRKKYFFVEETKNGNGKGGKYHGEGKIVADW